MREEVFEQQIKLLNGKLKEVREKNDSKAFLKLKVKLF